MYALDCETVPFSPGNMAPEIVCFQIYNGSGVHIIEPQRGLDWLEKCLDTGELLIGHNIAYDLACACTMRPRLWKKVHAHYDKGLVRDTEIREKLLRIAAGTLAYDEDEDGNPVRVHYGLYDLTKQYLGLELDKSGDSYRLRYGELKGVPIKDWPWAAKKYAWLDASCTAGVYKAQIREAGGEVTNELEQVRAAWDLHRMALRGMRTAQKRVEKLRAKLDKDYIRLQKILIRAGLLHKPRPLKSGPRKGVLTDATKNLLATRERVTWAYKRLGHKPPMTVKKKRSSASWKPSVSTSRDVLEASRSRALQAFADYGAVEKIRNTYLPILERGFDLPIHPGINVLVATGRTSMYSPNLQNIPRKGGVRECFVPTEGYVYLFCDYSAIELRTLAQITYWLYGHSELRELFLQGLDPHSVIGAELLGISYEEFKARLKAGDPVAKEARQNGKAINFGFPGGLGAKKFQDYARKNYGVILSEDEARARKETWFARLPEMRRYLQEFANECAEVGKVTQFVTNRVRGGVGYCDAANSPFQGLAADGIKAALRLVSDACYLQENSPLFGSFPVAMIHDELILEVPIERMHEAALELSRLMIAGMRQYVPDVPVETSLALAEYWFKGAEETRNAEGKIIPWRPKGMDKYPAPFDAVA